MVKDTTLSFRQCVLWVKFLGAYSVSASKSSAQLLARLAMGCFPQSSKSPWQAGQAAEPPGFPAAPGRGFT